MKNRKCKLEIAVGKLPACRSVHRPPLELNTAFESCALARGVPALS